MVAVEGLGEHRKFAAPVTEGGAHITPLLLVSFHAGSLYESVGQGQPALVRPGRGSRLTIGIRGRISLGLLAIRYRRGHR